MKKITIHAKDIDKATLNQFNSCHMQNFVIKASLMPDAHSGYVAPIGSVLITKDFIIPAWVGYDIGCGLITIKLTAKDLLEKINLNIKKIFSKTNHKVPMGFSKNHNQNISQKTKQEFKSLLNQISNSEHKELFSFIKKKGLSNLGTLGSGNHFIELGANKNNQVYLTIHSGSRNIGHKVAEFFMKLASNNQDSFEQTFPLDISSSEGKEYINYLNFCLDFALLNRQEIATKIHSILEETLNIPIEFNLIANKNHNHAIIENNSIIHRKGATPAKNGEIGIIPANMHDGVYLVKGKGSKDFLESSSHGAGRAMSRKKAKQTLSIDEFQKQMTNIKGIFNSSTIDEAPKAYKDINSVLDSQSESIIVLDHIKPIINWKGV